MSEPTEIQINVKGVFPVSLFVDVSAHAQGRRSKRIKTTDYDKHGEDGARTQTSYC